MSSFAPVVNVAWIMCPVIVPNLPVSNKQKSLLSHEAGIHVWDQDPEEAGLEYTSPSMEASTLILR